MDNISVLFDKGNINVKRKTSKSPRKTPLSKEYQIFLKRSKDKKDLKKHDPKKDLIKDNPKKALIKANPKKDLIKANPKKEDPKINVLRINKNIVKVIHNKDNNKSKNKFTKKSQEKRNKRNSKRKKIHRKITKTKHLSFKCTDKNVDIKKIIKEAQTKSNNEIKEILKKKGIDIKSNKNKLLKDLYLFTNCGNINIVRE